jgi:hypothetical protein
MSAPLKGGSNAVQRPDSTVLPARWFVPTGTGTEEGAGSPPLSQGDPPQAASLGFQEGNGQGSMRLHRSRQEPVPPLAGEGQLCVSLPRRGV